ncbi:unnamed protein product [Protopolystoma xenopodis]|uniref:Uncharacterized protein n=1 Tax=Protopolystoma xenopodis TaxID=117903 RepID=A0A3S5A8P3_9PLAT|nr:unnamed protein product [Protopolystoma xenopodis]
MVNSVEGTRPCQARPNRAESNRTQLKLAISDAAACLAFCLSPFPESSRLCIGEPGHHALKSSLRPQVGYTALEHSRSIRACLGPLGLWEGLKSRRHINSQSTSFTRRDHFLFQP